MQHPCCLPAMVKARPAHCITTALQGGPVQTTTVVRFVLSLSSLQTRKKVRGGRAQGMSVVGCLWLSRLLSSLALDHNSRL